MDFSNRREARQEDGMKGVIKNGTNQWPLWLGKWDWMHKTEQYVKNKCLSKREGISRPVRRLSTPIFPLDSSGSPGVWRKR